MFTVFRCRRSGSSTSRLNVSLQRKRPAESARRKSETGNKLSCRIKICTTKILEKHIDFKVPFLELLKVLYLLSLLFYQIFAVAVLLSWTQFYPLSCYSFPTLFIFSLFSLFWIKHLFNWCTNNPATSKAFSLCLSFSFSAFARYPNGVVVHYFCCKDRNACPTEQ